MTLDSALYVGSLRHRRFSPKPHEFTYPVFLSFLEIDRIPELMRASSLTAHNRWNLAAFYDRDHFGDPGQSLRARLECDAERNGVTLPEGRIFLLTHLRYLGYVFNPVSFFYFFDRSEKLQLMMAEVNNTFGESCNYWLSPAEQKPGGAACRYATAKRLHVSPFMSMNLRYDWIFTAPGESLVAHMNTHEHGSRFFDATLTLRRRPWNAGSIRGVLARYPLMTLRVIAAIHWQALALWWKGVPVFTHPERAATPHTLSVEDKAPR